MSDVIGSASYELDLDQKKFESGLSTASTKFKDFGKNLTDIGTKMSIGLTAPLTAIGVKAFDTAAQFQDALGATDQIFKNSSQSMKDWASSLETYYGVAQGEALEYGNMMGVMLTNIGGLTEEEASKQAQTLVELAGDLTAMFGGTTSDAVRALTQSLKGNSEMLDNYGMGVNDAIKKTKAMEMGLLAEGETMTLAIKQASTLALIMEQTGNAQGQAGREALGASGTLRTMGTEIKNLSKDIGELLIPIFNPLLIKIKDLIGEFKGLSTEKKKLIVIIGLVVAAIGPLLIIAGMLVSAIGTIAGAISLPVVGIGLLIGALVGLGAIFVKISNDIGLTKFIWDTLVATFNNVKTALASPEVQASLENLKLKLGELGTKLQPLIERLKELVGGEGQGLISVEQVIGYVTTGIGNMITVIEFLTPVLEKAIEGIINIVNAFVWFQSKVEEVKLFFSNFNENMGLLFESLKAMFIQKLSDIGNSFLQFFTIDLPFAIGKGVGLFIQFVKDIPQLLNNMVTMIGNILSSLWSLITSSFTNLVNSAVSIFQNLPVYIEQIWSSVLNFFVNQIPAFFALGNDVAQGFWEGLKNVFKGIQNYMTEQVNKIKESFKKGLQIHSPSKIFEFFGNMTGVGFFNGVKEETDKLPSFISGVMDKVKTVAKDSTNLAYGVASGSFLTPNLDYAGMGSFTAPKQKESVVINFSLDGIIARSRSEFRDIMADGIEAVNEDLEARGFEILGGGNIKGKSST